jgi:hypothetical protein
MHLKFRKRPVVIEAMQLDRASFNECVRFIGREKISDATSEEECYIGIETLEGEMAAREDDWIIKGIKGEFYPCKPDIFAATYEPEEPK